MPIINLGIRVVFFPKVYLEVKVRKQSLICQNPLLLTSSLTTGLLSTFSEIPSPSKTPAQRGNEFCAVSGLPLDTQCALCHPHVVAREHQVMFQSLKYLLWLLVNLSSTNTC